MRPPVSMSTNPYDDEIPALFQQIAEQPRVDEARLRHGPERGTGGNEIDVLPLGVEHFLAEAFRASIDVEDRGTFERPGRLEHVAEPARLRGDAELGARVALRIGVDDQRRDAEPRRLTGHEHLPQRLGHPALPAEHRHRGHVSLLSLAREALLARLVSEALLVCVASRAFRARRARDVSDASDRTTAGPPDGGVSRHPGQ